MGHSPIRSATTVAGPIAGAALAPTSPFKTTCAAACERPCPNPSRKGTKPVKQILLATVAGLTLATGGFARNAAAAPAPACPLTSGNGPIKHIVYLQFDNTHYLRDNPNVPSDLEQMPALLAFLTQKGTLSANNHTQIISHTSNGILSSITGVYPDRIGSAVANSFGYYANGAVKFQSDFTYWTNIVNATYDTSHVLIAETGKNAPAPWAAFTKAGCDFGAVALADMEFENTTTDIANAFGGTPALAIANASANKLADFEGIAIHCAQGSALCSPANNGVPDDLPDEPGGYTGFNALFGHKFVVPAIAGGATSIPDLLGGTISGFPNFDGMWPKVTGAYVAQMLEAGVPVVYGYLSDAHDNHANTSAPTAYGPGEAGYVQQLANYNAGFAAFFARLKADGIDETNTLFVITVEEGDHFAGRVPPGCDGVTKPCTYSRTPGNVTIGEVDVDLTRLMQANGKSVPGIVPATGGAVGFDTHYDMAPAVYVYGDPDGESAGVRQFEQDVARLTLTNPVTNSTVPLAVGLADRAEMRLLHMYGWGGNVPDPLRLPSFVIFGSPNFYVETYYAALCNSWPSVAPYACEQPAYAWNHGGIQSQIATTWLGLVGPGVINKGVDPLTWTDHTDIRPTILTLAGLHDSYLHDGRLLVEHLKPSVLPPAIANGLPAYVILANAYKQLNAPFGATAVASIAYATNGIATTSPVTHTAYLAEMAKFNTAREALVAQIRSYIEAAAFSNGPFSPVTALLYAANAEALTQQLVQLAAGAH